MKLNKFYIRYYPPGIVFEYQKQRRTKQKILDLFDIEKETDVEALAARIAVDEPLITPGVQPQLVALLRKLRNKSSSDHCGDRHDVTGSPSFRLDRTLSGGHSLPITNVCADKCATGSYDRTCRIWNARTGAENLTLAGHENAVYSVSLAVTGRALTGSFDKTARIWSLDGGGECLCTMSGHSAEVVAVDVCAPRQVVATSSMDRTTRLFSAATGKSLASNPKAGSTRPWLND
ncbi:dynein assembly factor with WDR repeat domains 1-like isoform X2 [Sipha flava]|uniref:Dynein assembly factor with WDR repeat domains 1-like isoform X2 n=1 Tax=Sipha flava TaxID=143950 RepID=A0A8B8GDW8_9HEMI|nr:dynein assembly factor with WDR repeat domains 1-like isoform X2 [Sipha flava]